MIHAALHVLLQRGRSYHKAPNPGKPTLPFFSGAAASLPVRGMDANFRQNSCGQQKEIGAAA